MKRTRALGTLAAILLASLAFGTAASAQSGWTLVGWNDLGMHCMDADFSVMAILPPYNNIHAQLIDPTGQLVTNPTGITVTYEAVADPDGSYNSTSTGGKTNFWQFVKTTFKADLKPDQGLQGFNMPGVGNAPQAMRFDGGLSQFTAEAIPLTPYDDAHTKNYYPMMHLVARDSSGNVLATTDIVLPISDEMTCRDCHSSQSGPAARPAAGWANNSNPELDYRLNVLLLHDEYQSGNPTFASALATAGYDPLGLYATATSDIHPVLCADCHGSNALPGTGISGIPPLTQAIHSRHAGVVDPNNGMTLGNSTNRSACYECHPGAETRCLRGAMGHAVAADGSLEMQCQSCHGSMAAVGSSSRQGWFDEPACQECHTGTATSNNGQIRYTSVFDSSGKPRTAVNNTFATNPDTPAKGISLFRFSSGHGGLQCESCHGSTHAIFPTSERNDNIQSTQIQGHVGTLAECEACHGTSPQTTTGGPHGMHPVGQAWVSRHDNAAESGGRAACTVCHGSDYRGTVLSRVSADRTISAFGTKNFWRGFQVGCYTCHNGPSSESGTSNHPPVTADLSASTTSDSPVQITLSASDADGNSLELRIVSQPQYGTVGLSGKQAVYYPDGTFTGTTTFTYAAWDGSTNSNLSTVTVKVGGGAPSCTVSCSASAPSSTDAGAAVGFNGSATASNCAGSVSYSWSFGDGSSGSSQQNPTHTYATAGTYTWRMTASAGGQSCSKSGTITVNAAPSCTLTCSAQAPGSTTEQQSVSFQAQAQTQGCSSSPTYAWNFGDGRTASGANVTHTYSLAGTYAWTVTATADGQTCVKSGSITVNPAPTCTITASAQVATSVEVRQNAEFRGNAQTEGCSGEPSYSWSFGDGQNAYGKDVVHAYKNRGTYRWTLTVSVNGSSSQTSGTISVTGRSRRSYGGHNEH